MQLQLFYDPKEIVKIVKHESVDKYYGITWTRMMRSKLREAKHVGLYDSIRQHGVDQPVVIRVCTDGMTVGGHENGEMVVGNGNHRLASALELRRWRKQVFVPVLFCQDRTFSDREPGYEHTSSVDMDY